MNYLFYKLYRGALYIRESNDADVRAWWVLCLLEVINIVTVYGILVFYINPSTSFQSLPFSIIVIIVAFISLTNYFLYIYKQKYLKIVEKFKNEKDIKRKIGISLVYLYVIITLIISLYYFSLIQK